MNGKKVSEIGSDIGRIAYKCESLTDIIPSKYRSIEVSTIIRENKGIWIPVVVVYDYLIMVIMLQ